MRELLAEERERADRLTELAALKAEFTSMVAHELGNPVTAIRRLSELLRVRQPDEEDRAQSPGCDRGPDPPGGRRPGARDRPGRTRTCFRPLRPRPPGARAQAAGLGLYVSRQLVRAHGSELAVRSRVQEGSTFSFELPVRSDGGRS